MILITLMFLVLYLVGATSLFIFQKKSGKVDAITNSEQFVTVVVPVRNEERNILHLLGSLKVQEGPFEVLVVNDHSDDHTVDLVNQFKEEWPTISIQLLELTAETSSPKKSAITLALKSAQGDIIVTTDGDCVVPKNWLTSIRNTFISEKVKMVVGGVYYSPIKTIFQKIQAYEQAALLFVSLTLAKSDHAFTCNGANLAYRKEVFDEVNGFEGVDQIASGDDEFLMKKVLKEYPNGIKVQEQAFVATQPNETFRQFFYQRIRWASKWRLGSLMDKLPAFLLLSIYLSLFFIPFAIITVQELYAISGLLMLKFVVDRLIVKRVYTLHQDQAIELIPLMFLFLLYPIYALTIGVFSNFLTYSWKGRRLK